MVIKTELFPGKSINWASYTVGGGSSTIEGSGHDLSQLGKSDCGGFMRLNRDIDTHVLGANTYWGVDAYIEWFGRNPVTDFWVLNGPPTEDDLRASGTTAIARTTPTNAAFSLSQAVGELMQDGLPRVVGAEAWRDRTLKARHAGSEYLNYEFGWLPMVNDVRNLARVVKNHHSLMKSYYEGSGKNMHVGFEFPSSFTSYDLSDTSIYDAILRWSDRWFFIGQQSGSVSRTNRTWFKGCFTYHATPPGMSNSFMDHIDRAASYADHLLGVRLTPETVWNLTPWSWAVDWFTNTGDIIHNISAFARDSLVLKYGYIMAHDRLLSNVVMSGGSNGQGTYVGGSLSQLRERKIRYAANPYLGFGTTGSLSGAQKAILLALGLSRTGF